MKAVELKMTGKAAEMNCNPDNEAEMSESLCVEEHLSGEPRHERSLQHGEHRAGKVIRPDGAPMTMQKRP